MGVNFLISAFGTNSTGSSPTPPIEDTPEHIVMIKGCQKAGITGTNKTTLLSWVDHAVTNQYYYYVVAGYFWKFCVSNMTYNFIDPTEDARLTYHGSVNEVVGQGLQFIGGSGWAETHIDAKQITGSPLIGAGSIHNIGLQNAFFGTPVGGTFQLFYSDGPTNVAYPNIANQSNGIPFSGGNQALMKVMQRIDTNTLEYWQTGYATPLTDTKNTNQFGADSEITLNRYASGGNTIGTDTHIAKLGFIIKAMPAPQMLAFLQGINTYLL